ncbi:MAG: hypothetical protein AAB354_15065 [candidate division KSB1 bacterium]
MPVLKVKTKSAPRSKRRKLVSTSNGFDDKKIFELLDSYRKLGELLEAIVGRERLYQPEFIKGLEGALREVASKKTTEVKSFADFIS